jgi:hypothetical protein
MTNHMARDQYGNTYHNLGPNPRKALLERLGKKHAEKMYVDTKEGGSRHVGWVIGGFWLTVYKVEEMGK